MKEGSWRRRAKEDVAEVFKTTNTVQVVKAQRLRRLIHLERLPNKRNAKKLLTSWERYKKRKGSISKRWLQAVKEVFFDSKEKIKDRRDWKNQN